MIKIPEGFPDLVGAVIKEDWGWDELPKKDSDIWNALHGPLFIGKYIRSAQTSYVKNILSRYLTPSEVQKAQNQKWGEKVLRVINAELDAIQDTPGESLKRTILKNVRENITSTNLIETLCEAFQFLKDHNVNVDKIKQIHDDYDKTIDIVDRATREIYNVGYTKAVLWLYNCGIANDLAPPNHQNRRFLKECGLGVGDDEDRMIFAPLCNNMRKVAKIVSKQLNKTVTAKQTQLAAWYLESCGGLPGMKGYKNRLTPRVLLDFLERYGWDVDNMDEKLNDIEQVGKLGEKLRNFLR